MSEIVTFHFEGSMAESHRMNFYESARFQYAAARLMVKLAQFRAHGKFVKKITNNSNSDIQLVSQSDGSFNINVEDPGQNNDDDPFINVSLADLLAYVSERIIDKVDETTFDGSPVSQSGKLEITSILGDDWEPSLERLVRASALDRKVLGSLPPQLQDLVKRRLAEMDREKRLEQSQGAISRIDFARSQKLIAMSAPLVSEMATALRRSADTLEVTTVVEGKSRSVLFLDQGMAREIETATVDQEITPILGDITQFNKDNGWGKLKIENGAKTLSFSIPYDILPEIKQKLIDHMKRDLVYLQTYFVRDRSGEVIRVIAVGILPTPT